MGKSIMNVVKTGASTAIVAYVAIYSVKGLYDLAHDAVEILVEKIKK